MNRKRGRRTDEDKAEEIANRIDLKEKLCFVKSNSAFFTTQPHPSQQWGPLWDGPSCDAGPPNEYAPDFQDLIKWKIYHVIFVAPLSVSLDTDLTVEKINAGTAPWLRSRADSKLPLVEIHAGVSITKFTELVHRTRGEVYIGWRELPIWEMKHYEWPTKLT